MNRQKGFTLIELMIVVVIGLVISGIGLIGWIWNIIKLVNMSFELTTLLVVRILGIPIFPVGMIVGYM